MDPRFGPEVPGEEVTGYQLKFVKQGNVTMYRKSAVLAFLKNLSGYTPAPSPSRPNRRRLRSEPAKKAGQRRLRS
jgi:hypothetical protein